MTHMQRNAFGRRSQFTTIGNMGSVGALSGPGCELRARHSVLARLTGQRRPLKMGSEAGVSGAVMTILRNQTGPAIDWAQ
jgi:hypothetical protein